MQVGEPSGKRNGSEEFAFRLVARRLVRLLYWRFSFASKYGKQKNDAHYIVAATSMLSC